MGFRNTLLSQESKRGLNLALNIALSDFRNRHARSILGVFWLGITPIGMLLIYWMVFGYTLNISWQGSKESNIGFVLPFFIGYSFFIFFSDIITSSLNLFVSKRNYVKKSPFPLWVLWAANFLRAIMQASIYFVIILVLALIKGYLTVVGLVLFSLLTISFLVFISAISLFLSAIGPFLGDLGEAARVALRVLFYMGPITYPLAIVPPNLQDYLWLNPLTNIIEPVRNALIFGNSPDPFQFFSFMFMSVLLMAIGYWFFYRASEAIVDVV